MRTPRCGTGGGGVSRPSLRGSRQRLRRRGRGGGGESRASTWWWSGRSRAWRKRCSWSRSARARPRSSRQPRRRASRPSPRASRGWRRRRRGSRRTRTGGWWRRRQGSWRTRRGVRRRLTPAPSEMRSSSAPSTSSPGGWRTRRHLCGRATRASNSTRPPSPNARWRSRSRRGCSRAERQPSRWNPAGCRAPRPNLSPSGSRSCIRLWLTSSAANGRLGRRPRTRG
ncbi:hypothetical protein T484DRAFT_1905779, partial [Baffinella frigidus]